MNTAVSVLREAFSTQVWTQDSTLGFSDNHHSHTAKSFSLAPVPSFSLIHPEVFICKYLGPAFPRKAHLKPPQLSIQQLVNRMPVSAFQWHSFLWFFCAFFLPPALKRYQRVVFTKRWLSQFNGPLHYCSYLHAKLHNTQNTIFLYFKSGYIGYRPVTTTSTFCSIYGHNEWHRHLSRSRCLCVVTSSALCVKGGGRAQEAPPQLHTSETMCLISAICSHLL